MNVIAHGGEIFGNVNAIKGTGGGSLLNFSLEEQVVGTWIDGRPIYQKTINDYDILNTANGTVLIAENIDFLISLPTGVAKFTNATDGSFNYGPLPQIAGFADYQIGANVMSDGKVRIERGEAISTVNYSSIIATMTFQYVKTTD